MKPIGGDIAALQNTVSQDETKNKICGIKATQTKRPGHLYEPPELLPLMLGSGFLTEAIGEPPVTVVGPARPAGLGDPEVVRPGESCKTEIKPRW